MACTSRDRLVDCCGHVADRDEYALGGRQQEVLAPGDLRGIFDELHVGQRICQRTHRQSDLETSQV